MRSCDTKLDQRCWLQWWLHVLSGFNDNFRFKPTNKVFCTTGSRLRQFVQAWSAFEVTAQQWRLRRLKFYFHKWSGQPIRLPFKFVRVNKTRNDYTDIAKKLTSRQNKLFRFCGWQTENHATISKWLFNEVSTASFIELIGVLNFSYADTSSGCSSNYS